MLSGPRRFRKTDAFAVIGVLTLLVWTPAYWAQGADERAVSGAETWVFPEPRAGDRAVLELVVKWGDEPAQSVGPVVTIEYRDVRPGEAPVPTSFVEIRRYTATDVQLGPLSFRMPEGEERLYLDADGRAVWHAGQTVTEGREAQYGPSHLEGGVRPSSFYRGLTVDAGNTVHYDPDTVPALVKSGARNIFTDNDWPTTQPDHITATRTTVHEGNRLYGLTDSVEDVIRSVAPQLNDDYRPTPEDGVAKLPIWFHLANHVASVDAAHEPARVAFWGWASKDFATQVGAHAAFDTASDRRLTIDLVPRTIERGAGAPHPVQHLQGFGSSRPMDQVPIPSDHELPKVALQDLMSSTTPIHGTLSLADVWRLARENAAGAPQRLIADGARPIEFRWTPGNSVTTAGEAPPEAPIGVLRTLDEATDPVTSKRSNWTLALATSDGRLAVLDLRIEETQPQGSFTATVIDNCADPDEHRLGYRWCDADDRWGRPIDWTTPIPSPDTLRTHLSALYPDRVHRTGVDAPGRLAWYGPIAYCHWSYQDNGAIGWGDAAILGGPVCTPSHSFWSYRDVSSGNSMRLNGASASGAPAEWRWDREDGHNLLYVEAESGYAYSSYKRTPGSADDPALGQARPVTPAAAAVVVDDPLGRSAAYTGLSLVVASLLVRIGAAIYAGAHLPMFAALFSRVSKADALLNERRSDIIELLRSDPGLTAQEVARRLDYSRTATVHHLETLTRTGQLLYVQNGQQRHYFPPDGTERERVRIAVARDEGYADLLQLIDEAPGVTLAELTTRLHRSKPRLSRMVARLERLGVLARRREGRTLRVFPATHAT